MNRVIRTEKILIGLEIHVTLNTKYKVFNISNSFIDEGKYYPGNFVSWELGHLGVLPIVNDKVIDFAIRLCIALNCKISDNITFDRKIYSYFDLSKGFQITQNNNPIGKNGFMPVLTGDNGQFKFIRIGKIQIEEDTAKSTYENENVFLDFSRASNPLIEIVTEPDFNNIEDVLNFAKQLRILVIYLGISNGKMEKGQFRMDLNFSFNFNNDEYVSPRYEVKNLNSFKNLKNAFVQELENHRNKFISGYQYLDEKNNFINQTLGYNDFLQKTFIQREKKTYSYILESNILPIIIQKKDISIAMKDIPPIFPWEIVKVFKFNDWKIMVENTFFLNFIKCLELKKIDYIPFISSIPKFVQNHLIPSFSFFKGNDFIIEDKILQIWKVFQYWMEKNIDKVNLKKFLLGSFGSEFDFFNVEIDINNLKESKKTLSFEKLKCEIEKIFLIDKNSKWMKNILSDKERLINYIFGRAKKKFPDEIIDYDDIEKISSEILNNLNDYSNS